VLDLGFDNANGKQISIGAYDADPVSR